MLLNGLLIGYMFIFICRIFEEYPLLGDIHLERIWVIFLIMVFLAVKGNSFGKFKGKIAPMLLLLSVFISVAGCQDIEAWSIGVENYVKLFVFYYILASSVEDKKTFILVIASYVAITMIYELKSLNEYYFHGRYVFRMGIIRLVGLGDSLSDPNAFASSVCFALPFAFALYNDKNFNKTKIKKIWLTLFVIISSACVVLTGSRSGFITLCAILLLTILRAKKRIKYIVITAVAVSIGFAIMPPDKKERIMSIFYDDANISGPIDKRYMEWAQDSAESRMDGFIDGFNLFLLKPLTGHGAANFSIVRGLVGHRAGLQAHNLFGQIMGELGVPGIIAWLSLVVFLIKSNLKIIRNDKIGLSLYSNACIFSTLLLIISGAGAHNLYRFNWLWYAAFTSIILKLNDKSKQYEIQYNKEENIVEI